MGWTMHLSSKMTEWVHGKEILDQDNIENSQGKNQVLKLHVWCLELQFQRDSSSPPILLPITSLPTPLRLIPLLVCSLFGWCLMDQVQCLGMPGLKDRFYFHNSTQGPLRAFFSWWLLHCHTLPGLGSSLETWIGNAPLPHSLIFDASNVKTMWVTPTAMSAGVRWALVSFDHSISSSYMLK